MLSRGLKNCNQTPHINPLGQLRQFLSSRAQKCRKMVNQSDAFLNDYSIEGIGINHTQMPIMATDNHRMIGHIADITGDYRIYPEPSAQRLY
jgi:hypothetical protein